MATKVILTDVWKCAFGHKWEELRSGECPDFPQDCILLPSSGDGEEIEAFCGQCFRDMVKKMCGAVTYVGGDYLEAEDVDG